MRWAPGVTAMQLPFTEEQFFDLFAAYNEALWPALIALWIALDVRADYALPLAGITLAIFSTQRSRGIRQEHRNNSDGWLS